MKEKLLQLWSSWDVLWDTVRECMLLVLVKSRVLKTPVKEGNVSKGGQGEAGLAPFISWCPHLFSVPYTPALCSFIGKGPQHHKICGMKGPRVCLVTSLLVTEIYQPPAFLRMLGGEQRSCEKHWAILNPFRKYNKKRRFCKWFHFISPMWN